MNILFILIDDKLDAHYIISEDVDFTPYGNYEEVGKVVQITEKESIQDIGTLQMYY